MSNSIIGQKVGRQVATPWRPMLKQVLEQLTANHEVPEEIVDVLDKFVEACVLQTVSELKHMLAQHRRHNMLPTAQA